MAKKYIDEAMRLNNATYNDYFSRLKLLAISLFKWEGLEEIGGNEDFLEDSLFKYGKACFVKDPTLGYLTLQASSNGQVNVYNNPISIVATGINYHKNFNVGENCVYIKNNKMSRPTFLTIDLIARRLYEVQRTIDVNTQLLKFPAIIEGSTKQALTLQNLLEQYSGNVPFIFGNKNFNVVDAMKTINLATPYIIDKLEIEKHQIWNECLTYLGIDNANTDKKERMITDEIESNNELTKYYLDCFYRPRQIACKQINDIFFNGKEKIKVTINNEALNLIIKEINDIINMDNPIDDTPTKSIENEGENNE